MSYFSFRAATLFLGLGASVASLVHCGGEPTADEAGAPEDADPANDGTGGDAGLRNPFVPDAGRTDAGTLDSGRDNADIVVCGGSKGDPTAVPLLDWSVVASRGKYNVVLGAKALLEEPVLWSANGTIVTGTVTSGTSNSSSFSGGGGPFQSSSMDRLSFAEGVMPETNVALTFEKSLGYSEALQGAYDLQTNAFDTTKVHRVAGRTFQASNASWNLSRPVRGPSAGDADYYVDHIDASRGFGWLFTVELDHPCKAAGLDALVGTNPLGILDPPAPHTVDEVSRFLVDNDAKLSLYVLTFGAEEPSIRAALQGTQASAATLANLEAAMTGVDAALTAYASNAAPPDYAGVTAGTNPSWVTGRVHAVPVSSIR